MVKISVIIPVYNCEKYLELSINSILNQTYNDFEILLINDGSTDSSYDICKKNSNNDSRIKVFNLKNGGPSRARNYGLQQAKGEYIYFCDADDYISNNMFEEVIGLLEKNKAGLIIFGNNNVRQIEDKFSIIGSNKCEFNIINNKDKFYKMYSYLEDKSYINPVWNKIYSKELIEKSNAKFPEGILTAEDFCFNTEIFKCSNKIIISDKCYYNYVSRGKNSLTTKFIPDKMEQLKYVYEVKKKFFYDANLGNKINELNNEFLLNISVFINNMFLAGSELKYKDKKLICKKLADDNYIKQIIQDSNSIGIRGAIIKVGLKNKFYSMLLLSGKMASMLRELRGKLNG